MRHTQVKRQAEWGVREIVKRQSGCQGTLSAVTVDLGTVSQSHILRAPRNHVPRKIPQGTHRYNATHTDETTSGMGGVREIVKRQIGCLGTLSAVTVDLGTASQSHILRRDTCTEVPSSTQSADEMLWCRVAHDLARLSPVRTNRDAHRIGSRFPLGPRSPSSISPDMYPHGMPNIPNGGGTSPRISPSPLAGLLMAPLSVSSRGGSRPLNRWGQAAFSFETSSFVRLRSSSLPFPRLEFDHFRF
jgi:hypothetical protein